MSAVSQLVQFTVGDCSIKTAGTDAGKTEPCGSALFLDSSQPFEGPDIIYLHGFVPGQIADKLIVEIMNIIDASTICDPSTDAADPATVAAIGEYHSAAALEAAENVSVIGVPPTPF
jgi:hypothetical protein